MVNSMICHFQLMEITGHLEFISDEFLTPSILIPPGEYEIRFSIKARSGISAYYKKKRTFLHGGLSKTVY